MTKPKVVGMSLLAVNLKPFQRDYPLSFPSSPPTNIQAFLAGAFSAFSAFLPQLRSNPRRNNKSNQPAPKLSKCPLKPLCSLSILAPSDHIGWFQNCIMRRIRRSAVGSPERKYGVRSAFCDSSLCAPSGRTIKVPVAKKRYHAQKAECSSSCRPSGLLPSSPL